MTDFYLGVTPQSVEWELRANVARFASPVGGVTRTLERVGSRWAATFKWDAVASTEAAMLREFLARQRGGANRFYCYDPSYTQRGSFSAPELFTNSDFSNGTTSWTPNGGALTSIDRAIRLTITNGAGTNQFYQLAALTQYAPHAVRSILIDGQQTSGLSFGRFISDGTLSANDYALSRGLGTVAMVASAAASSAQYPLVSNAGTGLIAGSYMTVPYTSLARCALVDNGPNMLLRSDEFDNAAWAKTKCTITANTGAAPDGNSTRDDLIEDNTSGQHFVSQSCTVSSAAGDYCVCVAARAGARGFVDIQIQESVAGHVVYQFFNLSTAAPGATGGVTGANWTNRRSFARDLGNGWVLCCLVGRKVSAGTTMNVYIISATADSGAADSYLGTNANALSLWRATAAQSSVPTRLVQTTSAATSGTSQTGAAVYLKGLPVSTDGLLYAGDCVEFITPTYSERKRVTAPLNSDAAGLGYLQFEPNLRQSPADNAAMIVTNPMIRMMLDDSTVKTQHLRAGVMACSFTAVEDVAA